MHPRTEELLQHLDAHRAALRRAVDAVPPTRRGERPSPDRWSVAEVLEHLSLVERRVAVLLARQIAAARAKGLGPERETTPVVPTLDLVRVADRRRPLVAPAPAQPTGLDAGAAWAALEAARAALHAALLTGDGLALGELAFPHPALGPLDLYQWVVFVGGHEARHADQIDEIARTLAGRDPAGPPA